MYEHITYEEILQRMLDRIPSSIDKREGSIVYDALAPAAIELQLMYIEFDIILTETFGDTASRDYLIKRAAERGVIPYPATNAVLKAIATPTTVEIPIGSRFSLNELNYLVTEKVSDGEYLVQCETKGVVGNSYFGALIPINYISGLESFEITEISIPGEDDEATEDIRNRYFETFDTKSYGGNKKDYIQKTNALEGVGRTKVTPVWNGAGTVLLTILNAQFDRASDTLVKYVQNEIDPTKDGTGVGIAPIGHIVTVQTVGEIPINVSAKITFKEGYSFANQKTAIEDAIKEYLIELRKGWADTQFTTVVVSQIQTKISNLETVYDITDTKINGDASNLVLDEYTIPIFGGVVNE